ncbi:uncharacterized protein MYCFIDRAFT_85397 [Pseudocercospora fijiensis CIRAD86]|uniref:Uncharacterized protein n=1 Tax=Pseudocercospora fijiensis (strain CIRAD86) TaxID=383855 RepID=M2ZVW2_PSEFD|nr:uncharacterized protein MYCFIDRAFT_85397 [Pseudocercospora fijiensis CIRAD86]EME83134.1 hypothetical protein MYCFIDRAFT_85397 [Pseudocercospora fijiensis CIRAD86]
MPSTVGLIAFMALALTALATPVPSPDGLLGGVTGALAPVTNTVSGTVGALVGSVPALLESQCNSQFSKCNVTVSGQIENLLTDGSSFAGRASVAGWVQNGHAYGGIQLAGKAPLPFNIKCDTVANVCLGTVSGNVTQVFANGKDIALWGWLTPSGHCDNGTCYGSVTALGDPAY